MSPNIFGFLSAFAYGYQREKQKWYHKMYDMQSSVIKRILIIFITKIIRCSFYPVRDKIFEAGTKAQTSFVLNEKGCLAR